MSFTISRSHMYLLASCRGSIFTTLRGLRTVTNMNTTLSENGTERVATESDGAATKKPRVEGDGAVAVQPEPARAITEVPPAERWKLKKVLLLVSYSGKGYLGMQR